MTKNTTMSPDERKRREQELAEKWRNLPPTNNFMFGKMFSDERLCKELLENLLHVKIGKLTLLPQIEKTVQASALSRGIRLDVYAEDSERAFDVEIQTTERGDLPLRVRYYQSAMDVGLLKRGEFYTSLKESYVIFLCTFDPFKRGQATYEFQTALKNCPDVVLDDKRHILLYNICAYKGERDSAIRAVLEFFATQKRETEFGRDAGAKLDEIRNDENWRLEYMTYEMALQDAKYDGREEGIAIGEERGRTAGIVEGEERGRKEGIAEGAHENALANARNFLAMGLSVEQVAQGTNLPLEQVRGLMKSEITKVRGLST